MMSFAILSVCIVILFCIALFRQSQGQMQVPLPESAVDNMSLEEARAKVEDFIAKGEKLFVSPKDETSLLPEQLGPITREFFSRYGTLRSRNGGFELSADGIKSSECVHGFLTIGHSEDWDVVRRPGGDGVFVVEGSEASETDMQACFHSVYHLTLDEVSRE